MELLMKEEVYKIIGAAMEVYNEMNCGYLEPVYQESLEFELTDRAIPFEAQKSLTIHYKNHPLKKEYIPDLICYGAIVAELKVLDKLTSKEESIMINYLKASKMRVGLLINFGNKEELEWKRFIN